MFLTESWTWLIDNHSKGRLFSFGKCLGHQPWTLCFPSGLTSSERIHVEGKKMHNGRKDSFYASYSIPHHILPLFFKCTLKTHKISLKIFIFFSMELLCVSVSHHMHNPNAQNICRICCTNTFASKGWWIILYYKALGRDISSLSGCAEWHEAMWTSMSSLMNLILSLICLFQSSLLFSF